MTFSRRTLLQAAGASLAGLPFATYAQSDAKVVIIGGGFGGATAAKYLKRFNPALRNLSCVRSAIGSSMAA